MFLLRDLVSPRTWLAMTSHLAGLFTGLLVMVVVVTGLSLGFSLLVLALAGLPLLGLTLRLADWFAVAERARIGLMLGARIPAWPGGSRAGYRWYVVPRWRTLTQRATWGEIGYALLRLPVSAVALTLSVSAWSAALVLLALPLYSKYLPSGGAVVGRHGAEGHAHDDGLGGDRRDRAADRAAGDPRAGHRGRQDVPLAARPAQRPGRPGDRTGDQPGTGGGRGRGGAAADRA